MPRPINANIDLAALAHNHKLLKSRVGAARMWTVIKANAYGHGLVRVARTLRHSDGFAVIDLADAVRLREAGVAKPILLLEGFYEPRDIPFVTDYKLHTVLHSSEQIDMLERTTLRAPIDAYFKINTGMNRLGLEPVRLNDAVRRFQTKVKHQSISFMTHFADADGPGGVADQLARFDLAVHGLEGECSVANSAAILRYPQTHLDWVRPGIALYGCSPFEDETAAAIGLQPVMSLRSDIIAIQTIAAGARVGYGGTFRADRDMRIGVVACGYADGYPRHAPTGTPVRVEGRRTTIVGRVSMDKITIDLTRIPEAGVGSEVVLWGDDPTADEVARAAGTVSYELLAALAPRVTITESE